MDLHVWGWALVQAHGAIRLDPGNRSSGEATAESFVSQATLNPKPETEPFQGGFRSGELDGMVTG